MPSTPLIETSAIPVDFEQLHADHDAVRAVLKQRGTFAQLDGVIHYDEGDPHIIGYKDVKADDWWAPDHIPGRPIFPGVLMIEGGAQLCSYDFLQRRMKDQDVFVGFGGVDKTRFRGAVTPDCRLIFVAREKRIRRSMFTYEVQGFVDRTLVFESDIIGVLL